MRTARKLVLRTSARRACSGPTAARGAKRTTGRRCTESNARSCSSVRLQLMTRLRTRAQCAWTTRIPADELDEDGYQRPGAAAGAPAVLPPAAFFWLRQILRLFQKLTISGVSFCLMLIPPLYGTKKTGTRTGTPQRSLSRPLLANQLPYKEPCRYSSAASP